MYIVYSTSLMQIFNFYCKTKKGWILILRWLKFCVYLFLKKWEHSITIFEESLFNRLITLTKFKIYKVSVVIKLADSL